VVKVSKSYLIPKKAMNVNVKGKHSKSRLGSRYKYQVRDDTTHRERR
jgi:hypothetical protein